MTSAKLYDVNITEGKTSDDLEPFAPSLANSNAMCCGRRKDDVSEAHGQIKRTSDVNGCEKTSGPLQLIHAPCCSTKAGFAPSLPNSKATVCCAKGRADDVSEVQVRKKRTEYDVGKTRRRNDALQPVLTQRHSHQRRATIGEVECGVL